MTYKVAFTKSADAGFLQHKKHGNKLLIKKIIKIRDGLSENPRGGIGKPERLKNYKEREIWSKRIDQEHRFIYEIFEEDKRIEVLSVSGHYTSTILFITFAKQYDHIRGKHRKT